MASVGRNIWKPILPLLNKLADAKNNLTLIVALERHKDSYTAPLRHFYPSRRVIKTNG
jgi:hypothetical protein